jgi:hypothetical protein
LQDSGECGTGHFIKWTFSRIRTFWFAVSWSQSCLVHCDSFEHKTIKFTDTSCSICIRHRIQESLVYIYTCRISSVSLRDDTASRDRYVNALILLVFTIM